LAAAGRDAGIIPADHNRGAAPAASGAAHKRLTTVFPHLSKVPGATLGSVVSLATGLVLVGGTGPGGAPAEPATDQGDAVPRAGPTPGAQGAEGPVAGATVGDRFSRRVLQAAVRPEDLGGVEADPSQAAPVPHHYAAPAGEAPATRSHAPGTRGLGGEGSAAYAPPRRRRPVMPKRMATSWPPGLTRKRRSLPARDT